MNAEYWTTFYSKVDDRLEKCSNFCKFTTLYLKNNLPTTKTIVDMGCGNGRDLRYFISQGYDVLGVDSSKVCSEEQKNVKCDNIVTCMFGEFDIYYSRFSLHSLPYENISIFLANVAKNMTNSSLFFIETRSIKGTEHSDLPYIECEFASPIGGVHTRTLLNLSHLTNMVINIGFKIIYCIESKGLATFEHVDPMIIRLILCKMDTSPRGSLKENIHALKFNSI
jgi:tellurite methyltransferase